MPVLAVFHATGQQGSSVIDNVLSDSDLSKRYSIRALTRDTASAKAVALKSREVEVAYADTENAPSLQAALEGTDFVFAVTTPDFSADAVAVEYARAKAIADAAVAAKVKYMIFSTLAPVSAISAGKLTKVYAYDAKAKAEEYMRSLSPQLKSAFFAGAPFMQNFEAQAFMGIHPSAEGDGTYVWKRNMSPQASYPLIDGIADTGKFVLPILADPQKFEGKTLYGAERIYTLEEISAIMSSSSGKTVRYQQISDAAFHKSLFEALGNEIIADVFVDGFHFYEQYGAFGPGTAEKIEWSVAQVKGKLTSLEEYLQKLPLKLE